MRVRASIAAALLALPVAACATHAAPQPNLPHDLVFMQQTEPMDGPEFGPFKVIDVAGGFTVGTLPAGLLAARLAPDGTLAEAYLASNPEDGGLQRVTIGLPVKATHIEPLPADPVAAVLVAAPGLSSTSGTPYVLIVETIGGTLIGFIEGRQIWEETPTRYRALQVAGGKAYLAGPDPMPSALVQVDAATGSLIANACASILGGSSKYAVMNCGEPGVPDVRLEPGDIEVTTGRIELPSFVVPDPQGDGFYLFFMAAPQWSEPVAQWFRVSASGEVLDKATLPEPDGVQSALVGPAGKSIYLREFIDAASGITQTQAVSTRDGLVEWTDDVGGDSLALSSDGKWLYSGDGSVTVVSADSGVLEKRVQSGIVGPIVLVARA